MRSSLLCAPTQSTDELLEELELLARDHGWLGVGNGSGFVEWLRKKLDKVNPPAPTRTERAERIKAELKSAVAERDAADEEARRAEDRVAELRRELEGVGGAGAR